MIGAMYTSDQKIVDIYKDVSTIAESQESKMAPEEVMNYIELISVNNKTLMNFNHMKIFFSLFFIRSFFHKFIF